MSRSLPANTSSALDDAFLVPVVFVELLFDSAPLRLHTDLGSIVTTDTSPNKTWLGAGDLGAVGPIEETEGAEPFSVELTLSGLDSTVLDEARNQDYQDRPVVIYVGVRDSVTGALVDNPTEIFYGQIDQMVITAGRQFSSVTVRAESEQTLWQRPAVIFYDAATLQDAYAGETFFNFLEELQNLQLRWGTENPNVNMGDNNTRINPASVVNFF